MVRGMHAFHPISCFLYLCGAFLLVMLEQHPDFLLLQGGLLSVYVLTLKREAFFKKWGPLTGVFFLLIIVMNPLLNHQGTHILFYLGANPITLEAVIKGVMMALSLLNILMLAQIFNYLITSEKFLFLFSRFFPRWALLVMLTLRFIPLFRYRLMEIEQVQKVKGYSLKSGTLRARFHTAALLIQILLTWSLEEAIQTADSMTARGYGIGRRSYYHPYKLKRMDGWFIGLFLLILILNAYGVWLGDAVLAIAPILETLKLQGREWLYLGVCAGYFLLPLLIDLKEGWTWRSLKQKM